MKKIEHPSVLIGTKTWRLEHAETKELSFQIIDYFAGGKPPDTDDALIVKSELKHPNGQDEWIRIRVISMKSMEEWSGARIMLDCPPRETEKPRPTHKTSDKTQ